MGSLLSCALHLTQVSFIIFHRLWVMYLSFQLIKIFVQNVGMCMYHVLFTPSV
jgi:hypothetical protein